MKKYQIGQVVKLDFPPAYGVISEILAENDLAEANKGIGHRHLRYSVGDPVIEFMEYHTLPEQSTYRLSDPCFANVIHTIDPSSELRILRIAKRKNVVRFEGINLESAIKFLEKFLPQTSGTNEEAA